MAVQSKLSNEGRLLHLAAARGCEDGEDEVRSLLDQGADVNFQDELNLTPLLRASRGGHPAAQFAIHVHVLVLVSCVAMT